MWPFNTGLNIKLLFYTVYALQCYKLVDIKLVISPLVSWIYAATAQQRGLHWI